MLLLQHIFSANAAGTVSFSERLRGNPKPKFNILCAWSSCPPTPSRSTASLPITIKCPLSIAFFNNIIQCTHIWFSCGEPLMTQWRNWGFVDDVMGKLGAPWWQDGDRGPWWRNGKLEVLWWRDEEIGGPRWGNGECRPFNAMSKLGPFMTWWGNWGP